MIGLSFFLGLAVIGAAQPAAPPPLKTISHLHASPACTALRKNVGRAIQGILVNDQMVDQGRLMLYKVRRDGIAAPLGAGWSGGAGPSSSLDDAQLGNLVGVLAKNLEKIDGLLRTTGEDGAELTSAKAGLERVAAQQRAELNILSANVFSNESNDLNSRKALAPGSESQGPPRISMAEELVAQQRATQQVETNAALAMKPLIDGCSGH